MSYLRIPTFGHGTPGRRPRTRGGEGDTRAAILRAARSVFAKRGLEGASIRDVADAAGVNIAMIYYHFKDKVDLYRSVLADSLAAMALIWEDDIFRSAASVKDKIRKYVEGYIRFHQSNEELRRIMAMEFAASGGNMTWICEKFFADNFARLAGLFREGIKRGEMRRFDPFVAAASLIGIIVHNFIMRPVSEYVSGRKKEFPPRKLGEFVTELFFSGLGKRGVHHV